MSDTLEKGLATARRVTVDRERTIGFMGEDLRVYSTPAMVGDIEYTCLELIAGHLAEGQSSVGVKVAVDHLSATPMDHWIEVRVTVTEVEGRRVSFEAEVVDALETVGRGKHTRFVIDVARQAERLKEKAAGLANAD